MALFNNQCTQYTFISCVPAFKNTNNIFNEESPKDIKDAIMHKTSIYAKNILMSINVLDNSLIRTSKKCFC